MQHLERLPTDEPKYVPYKRPYLEYCFKCQKTITTTTHRKCGMLNFLLFIVCIFFPFLVFCFWCPCFQDTEHHCPECKNPVGRRDII